MRFTPKVVPAIFTPPAEGERRGGGVCGLYHYFQTWRNSGA